MIHYYTQSNGAVEESEDLQSNCWVHISPPFNLQELQNISRELEIPLDFLRDALDIDERSRHELEDDVKLIVLNSPLINETNKDNEAIYVTVPFGIVSTPDHILTITGFDNPLFERFVEGKVKKLDIHNEKLFILQLFEHNVYRFLECLKKLNMKRNIIEQELYDSPRNLELQQLLRIEKSLVYFVNTLSSNDLLKMKMKRTDFLSIRDDEELTDLFEDIIVDNSQALEMSNVYTNILSGTMDAYASMVSNNLNVFIQRLTIITIVLMVPTLVASFYGMNVKLPFMDGKFTFYGLIMISIIIGGLLVWFFKRKKVF
jgi:magnesium transporter